MEAEAERQRWSEVSVRKSGGDVEDEWWLREVKAEVEKREEKGFLLLERERPGSWRAVERKRPRLRLERMMLSKRVMDVWTEVEDDEVGAGGVHSRSDMNSLKAGSSETSAVASILHVHNHYSPCVC